MSEELKKWCNKYEFDFDKFSKLDLSLETLASTRSGSIIVLAEQLGLSTSSERGKFIDAVKLLKQNMGVPPSPVVGSDNEDDDDEDEDEDDDDIGGVGLYDDPEVIVKGNDGGDYNEFEDDGKEQKSIHEESFMLRSNFSDDPEDQWDIVKFFDNNEKFKKFKPILLLQMQMQNNQGFNGDGTMGDQNQQLDHLLDTMLGGAGNQNDSSSDSDDDDDNIYNSQQDGNTFREYILSGYMPSPASLIYDNILKDYSFDDSKNIRKEETDEKAPFYANIEYAQVVMNENKEHFMSISLKNNINKDEYSRYQLNLVIVLETSSTMNDLYNDCNDSKQIIANSIACSIIDQLNDEDRICFVTFNDTFDIQQTLDDIKSIDIETFKNKIMSIESTEEGGFEFDEGYNAALGQLQEWFDMKVMMETAANNDDNDDEKEELIENRIIMITNNLPNSDSSLMDLIQVYSDSDENKIYTSFININEQLPSNKLTNNINKLRGCNIYNYLENDKQTIIAKVKYDFDTIVNPIYFNIQLILQQCKTDTIYGYNNNMKKITKLNGTGLVRNIKTFFLTEQFLDKNEIITIRLQPEDDENQDIKFEYTLTYETRDGKFGDIKRQIILNKDKDNGIFDNNKDQSYFDNISIRKRILLIKFIEFLNEWVSRDSNTNDTNLNVSSGYKSEFEAFLKYFKIQSEQIKDDLLDQEVEIINKLINFDENESAQLRKASAS